MSLLDRLKELLPLVLVGAILLVFYLTRAQGPALSFLFTGETAPTPVVVAPIVDRASAPAPGAISKTPFCNSTRPQYVGGMASLKAALGTNMGDPLECERAINVPGDTQQNTTTGLAYYRKQLNVTCFTTGWDHWAMRGDGTLLHWAGDAVDPPPDATRLNR